MAARLSPFTLAPAHVGHVLDAAPRLRELDPQFTGEAVTRTLRLVSTSRAWAIVADGDVLAIVGALPGDPAPWAILVPVLVRHRDAFSLGAYALAAMMRATLPRLEAPAVRDPDEAREWLFDAARRFSERSLPTGQA
jgi:hypothetical protein